MRSADVGALKDVDTKFHAAIEEAVKEENARWNGRGAVTAGEDNGRGNWGVALDATGT